MAAPAFKASIKGMRLDLLLMGLILHHLLRCTKVKCSRFSGRQLDKTRDEGIGVPGRQIDPDAVTAARGDADRLAGLVFHAHQRRDMVARGVYAFQFVADRKAVLADDGVVDRLAIGLGGAGNVVRALGAAFDLQRIDADVDQALDVLDGAQVFRVQDVGAVLVFFDRHQFARALLFFDDDFNIVFGQKIRLTVGFARFLAGCADFVVPAAGIGAGTLVRVAVIEVAGEQAAAGVGDAQRAMDEDFELDVRALLADFCDLVERQFARQNHALAPAFLPDANRRPIDGIGLHRQVDGLFRPGFAHHVDQPGVGHDQRVGLQLDDRRHVGQVGGQLGVVREDVADNEKLLAAGVRFVDAFLERGDGAELVVAHAQAVARLAGIDRIGAEGKGGAHHLKRAGRGEEFRRRAHSRIRKKPRIVERMTEEILINFTPQETRVAVMQQGVVQELHIERTASRGLVGNVYLGRICRILPGMQSAFIDVGLERTAFLHVADIWQPRETATERPIEKILHDGQSILVQVVKDPIGTKGARLSTQVSIAGRMLVYLPQEKHIGISQRIESESEREVLREKITRLVPAEEPGGFIVRTMAESASDEEFATDIAYLRKTWADIRDKARTSAPPTLLYQELSLGQRVLRDFVNPGTTRIVIDSRENFVKLNGFAEEYTPAVLPLLEHYTGQRPLFDLHGVEDEIQKALPRRVDLKSGGYLIIDQTEAMTTIDVNTGGFVGVRNFDDTIFKTNLEAAVTIARQLRLRNLGGIIIVDFIDMENEEHKKAVLDEFNRALAYDHTRLTVNGFTEGIHDLLNPFAFSSICKGRPTRAAKRSTSSSSIPYSSQISSTLTPASISDWMISAMLSTACVPFILFMRTVVAFLFGGSSTSTGTKPFVIGYISGSPLTF